MGTFDIYFQNLPLMAEKIRQQLNGKMFNLTITGSSREAKKLEVPDCRTFGDQVYFVAVEGKSFSLHLRYETLTKADVQIIAAYDGRELPIVNFEDNLIGLCYQTGADWVIIQVEIKGE